MPVHRTITVRASSRSIVAVLNSTDMESAFSQYPDARKAIKDHLENRLLNFSKEVNRDLALSTEALEKYNEMKKDTSHGSLNDFRASQYGSLGRRTSQSVLDDDDYRTSTSLLSSSIAEWNGPEEEEEAEDEEDISPLIYFPPADGMKKSPSIGNAAATLIKHGGNNGPRRASVAVWADQRLMQMMQNVTSPNSKENNKHSKLSGISMIPAAEETISIIEKEPPVFGIGSLGKTVLQQVLKHLDFYTLFRFRLVSRQITELITSESEKYPGLCSLDFSRFSKTMDDNILKNVGEFCGPAIVNLSLKGCFLISDVGLHVICTKMPTLRVLNLSSVWNMTDAGLTLFDFKLSPLTSQKSLESGLTSLDLSNCRKITDTGIQSLLDSCKQLEHLELSYCKNLTAKIFEHPIWSRFKKLNLQRCTAINDAGFKIWHTSATSKMSSTDGEAESAQVTFKMDELNLSDCSFLTDAAIGYIVQSCPDLSSLILSFCCGLSTACIPGITQYCSKLRLLDLSFCGSAVTDETLLQLSTLPALGRLSVRGCVGVTDAGVQNLSACQTLKVINISQCRSVSKGISLGNCLIIRDGAGWV